MLTITKPDEKLPEPGTNRLIVKINKSVLLNSTVEPKQLNELQQSIRPTEKASEEPMFEIYQDRPKTGLSYFIFTLAKESAKLYDTKRTGGFQVLSYCTNYLATMPDIIVYMNCDTRLAVNLGMFNLGEHDEFIFAIKNYNYIDSPAVFLFRARKDAIDENGEVIFKITPEASKQLKPGAFYNFAVLANAFDPKQETEYKKLTDNGNVIIEYGAQDLTVKQEVPEGEIAVLGVRLELLDEISSVKPPAFAGQIVGMRLEQLDD